MTAPARLARRIGVAAGATSLVLTMLPGVARAAPSEGREPRSARSAPDRPGMRRLQQARDRRLAMDPRRLDSGPAPGWLVPRPDDHDAPRSNDAFAAAELITNIPTMTPAGNSEATTESGEPVPSCAGLTAAGSTVPLSGATLWYRFTPRASGRILVRTMGGSPTANPVVAVYRGTTLTGLTEVACNDNDPSGGTLASSAYVNVTLGLTYYLQIGSVLSQSMSVYLAVQPTYEGSISGTLRDGTGAPLQGICVISFREDGDWYDWDEAVTDASGHYLLSNIAQGDHRIRFTDCQPPLEYLEEWYRDAATYDDATVVQVGTTEVGGIDGVLTKGASISGTVTDETGKVLRDICVAVYSDEEYSFGVTDGTGRYLAGALEGGEYVVSFRDCANEVYVSEYYDDQPTAAKANRVSVAPEGSAPGVNASLARGASISGSVVDDVGDPRAWTCISARDARGNFAGSGNGDGNGAFRIGALPAGEYRLRVSACDEDEFVTEWYQDEPDLASADPIDLAPAEDLHGVVFRVSPGGTIEGTVNAEGAGPFPNACIDVYDASGEDVGWSYTSGDGSYSVAGLPPGGYRIQFYDCGNEEYASSWYGGAPDFASAAQVVVTDGTVTDIDGTLPIGGSISGTITGPDGEGLPEVCADAVDGAGWWLGYDYSESGAYRITGIRPGDVSVTLSDCWEDLAPEWYPNAAHRSAGEPVPVINGQDTGGIDAELGPGGWIEGRITSASGAPIRYVCVDAYDASGDWAGWGETSQDGSITSSALFTGEYRLELIDCDEGVFQDEWYEDASSYADATPILVRSGEPTVIEAIMELRGEGSMSLEIRFDGGGRIASAPAGIDCLATCTASFAGGGVVTLSAEPASGFAFAGWKGAGCSGQGTCTVSMTDHRAVRALFTQG